MMEIQNPSFLTKDFVREALRNSGTEAEKDVDEIINLEIDKPIAKGNNYVCEIFRVKVKYTKKSGGDSETSLIVKAPVANGGEVYGFILSLGIIQKESKIYSEYLQKVEQLFKQHSIKSDITVKSYKSSVENVIIMEDLKFKGFKMADRVNQLDYEHCAIALSTLAKFHAASVKLYETEKELVEQVGLEVFYREELREKNNSFAETIFKVVAEDMKTWPEEYNVKKYIDQINAYAENAWDILVECALPKENEFVVLNHGDFWVTNMLFNYGDGSNSGKPTEVKLLDLQLCRWASPALDLHYFINGSMQEEIRSTKLDKLLDVYLNELNSSLELLDCKKRLEKSELKEALDLKDFFGFSVSNNLLPVVIADPKEAIDMKDQTMDDLKNLETNPFRRYFKNEKFRKLYTKRLVELGKKGWF